MKSSASTKTGGGGGQDRNSPSKSAAKALESLNANLSFLAKRRADKASGMHDSAEYKRKRLEIMEKKADNEAKRLALEAEKEKNRDNQMKQMLAMMARQFNKEDKE